jgi:hypothetical protein
LIAVTGGIRYRSEVMPLARRRTAFLNLKMAANCLGDVPTFGGIAFPKRFDSDPPSGRVPPRGSLLCLFDTRDRSGDKRIQAGVVNMRQQKTLYDLDSPGMIFAAANCSSSRLNSGSR